MDNPRPGKVAIVEELVVRFNGATAVFFSEYRGLRVSELEGLRGALREVGSEHKIFKNTLVHIACERAGLSALDPLLTGPTALTFVQGDVAAAAKRLRDLSRQNPLLVIKGGLLEGSILGARDVAVLADLPSREVLLAQLAGVMAGQLASFAGVLQALPRNLAYGLAALRDQREAA